LDGLGYSDLTSPEQVPRQCNQVLMRVTIPDPIRLVPFLNPNVLATPTRTKAWRVPTKTKRTCDISCRKSLRYSVILPDTGLEPARSCDHQALNLIVPETPHLTRTGNTLVVPC
jgi:hypothetical protein